MDDLEAMEIVFRKEPEMEWARGNVWKKITVTAKQKQKKFISNFWSFEEKSLLGYFNGGTAIWRIIPFGYLPLTLSRKHS